MKILFSELFWGSLLILGGISIVLKAILGIDIPIFRIFFALILIYAGFMLITGPRFHCNTKHTFMFTETHLKPEIPENYTTAFGKMTIDLTDIKLEESKKININTMFGETIVKINKEIPTTISVNASFANAELPNKTAVSFGRSYYQTQPSSPETNRLFLNATVVFGNLEILEV